eukprot:760765-Hanusia_phi.AAC.4
MSPASFGATGWKGTGSRRAPGAVTVIQNATKLQATDRMILPLRLQGVLVACLPSFEDDDLATDWTTRRR